MARFPFHPATVVLAAVLALALAQCGGGTASRDGGTSEPANAPTYWHDVRPILTARCVGCHQPGNIAPFSLTGVDEARPFAAMIAQATRARLMPPFPPDTNGCAPIDDPRNMPQSEIDVLAAWAAAGAPAGDPATEPPPAPAPADDLGPATMTWDTGVDYYSRVADGDDYRCFVVDPHVTNYVPFDAVSAAPGNLAIAHHAVVFVALAADAPAARALEDEDPEPGYSCFGGARLANAAPLSVWVPGARPRPYPEHTGSWLPPGSIFIVQVHYNFNNGRGADRTRVQLWRPQLPPTQLPGGFLVGNYTFRIPAGESDYSAQGETRIEANAPTTDLTQARPGMIYQVALHEHLRGRSVRMDVMHADGSTQCLVNIPRWDFHWQGQYQLATPVRMLAGDRLRITCHWDNSAANQPVVNRARDAPHDVTFGENSNDEMCVGWGYTTPL